MSSIAVITLDFTILQERMIFKKLPSIAAVALDFTILQQFSQCSKGEHPKPVQAFPISYGLPKPSQASLGPLSRL